MKYKIDEKEIRVYYKENSCIFKKNNEEYGALSNMATGFPLRINNINIKTTEALYQACRFPHLPELQKKIVEEKSPMVVKMISNANKKNSRQDWDSIRLKIMKWCIQLKLAQNYVSFGAALHQTGLKNIVENSAKDNFWGAIPNSDGTVFSGKNALGRLLMDLRQTFYSKDCYSLLYVKQPEIENLFLYNEPIGVIDERNTFINYLYNYWKIKPQNGEVKSYTASASHINELSILAEPEQQIEVPKNKKRTSKTKETLSKKEKVTVDKLSLFDAQD